MFIRNNLRFNINCNQIIGGVEYPSYAFNDPEIRDLLGITEIPDPPAPLDFTDELYYRNETNEPPFVVYTKKPIEQINNAINYRIKMQIVALESTQHRALREAILFNDTTRLRDIDNKIVELRKSMLPD